jgi:hypothetical protein
MQFLNFPEEIWAELLLRDGYPDWFGRRMERYTQMREGNFNRREGSRASVPPPLHRYWVFYELLRVELGRRLDRDQRHKERLGFLAEQWGTELGQVCDDSHADRLLARLADLIPMDVNASRVSETLFKQLFDEVLAVAPN